MEKAKRRPIKTVGVRVFQARAPALIRDVERRRRPVAVARHEKVVAYLVPVQTEPVFSPCRCSGSLTNRQNGLPVNRDREKQRK